MTNRLAKENPCYKCTDREVGCHGRCDKYKAWRQKYTDQNEKIFAIKGAIVMIEDYQVNEARRRKKMTNVK